MKKKDRRKEKPTTKELIAVTVQNGTKDKILKITNNLSSFVNDAIIAYLNSQNKSGGM